MTEPRKFVSISRCANSREYGVIYVLDAVASDGTAWTKFITILGDLAGDFRGDIDSGWIQISPLPDPF